MKRALVIAGMAAFVCAQCVADVPAMAQAPTASNRCAETPAKKAKKSMFGSLLGSIADSALGRAGVPTSVVGVSLPVGSMLSDALLSLLDCKEQQQAAQATDQAIRGGVGTEVAWKSETRANVTGKSTVTGKEELADGSSCVTVNDVVIIEGQETTVPKKMCRSRGANGYVKV